VRSLDASRVRRLAAGVHQSLSNEIIVEDKHKKPKDQAPSPPPQKKPNKSCQGVASAADALLLARRLTGRRDLGVVI
jgi:hypothetical protein